MPHPTTWILVANSSQAKIFKMLKFPKMEILKTFFHEESRLHDQDLVSDRPGRAFDSVGVGRHSYESKHDPKEVEIDKFGKILADFLSVAHEGGEFTRLYVAANPSFLGVLRQEMKARLQESIVHEIPKDFTERPTEDIEKHLESI